MRVKEVAVVTDPGRGRRHNEDAVLHLADIPAFAVADGMGGRGAGEVAASIAMDTLVKNAGHLEERATRVEADRSSEARLELGNLVESTFNQAHLRIARESQKKSLPLMATTLVTAVIAGGHAYIGHVGDSRAYVYRDGRLRTLTEDHSLAMLRYRQGRLTLAQRRTSPLRNRLYQVLGAGQEVDPDTAEVSLADGDVLLLCSDGLTRTLDDEDIAFYLKDTDCTTAARRLVDAANEAGGPDNISVILARIGMDAASHSDLDLISSILAEIFLFKEITDVERMVVAPYLEELVLRPGQVLFREGDPGDAFFVVVSGKVRVSKGGVKLVDVGPGGNLGELSLSRAIARSATVTAVDRTRLYALHRDRFNDILKRRPQLGARLSVALLDTVSNRIRDLSDRLAAAQMVAEGELTMPGTDALELVKRAVRGDLNGRVSRGR